MNDCNYLSGMLCVAGIAFLVAFDFLDSILTLALTASSRGFVMYRYLCSLLLFKAVSYLHDSSNQSATDLKSSIVYHFGCMTPKYVHATVSCNMLRKLCVGLVLGVSTSTLISPKYRIQCPSNDSLHRASF